METLGKNKKVNIVDQDTIKQARLSAIETAAAKGVTCLESLPYPQYAITEEIRTMLQENGISLPDHYNPYNHDTTPYVPEYDEDETAEVIKFEPKTEAA